MKETDNRFYLDIPKMEYQIKSKFDFWKVNFVDDKKMAVNGLLNLKKLFKLLITFKIIGDQTINIIKKF